MKTSAVRWFDWFSAILLIAAFGTVAIRLRVTDWTSNLDVIEFLVLMACVLGLLLGKSQFSGLACQLFAINFSLFFVPWQLGLLVGNKINWDERLLNLFSRLNNALYEVIHNHPVQDPLLFIAVMSLFFWILALVAGYQLARHGRPWVSIILLGLALAVIDFYTPYQSNRDRYSGVFVFLVLLMIARIYLLRSRREWTDKGMAVDPEIGYDLGRTVAISGLVLVLLAWNFPTIVDALTPGNVVQKELAKQWDTIRNRFQNAVAGLQNPVSVTSDYYGSELALGTGGSQGDQVVFTVQVRGGRPTGVRFYWRARSFDIFDGSQWLTSEQDPVTVPANQWPFRYPQYAQRDEVTLTFSPMVASMRNIYTAGIPLQIGHKVDVLGDKMPDGTTDVVALTANPPLRAGEVIQERSWVSVPTILELQASSQDYSQAIKDQYLQLPSDLPTRVTDLAKQITAGLTNPYDQTMAITDWLRKNIEYSLTIPTPPANQNVLDWFLFDLKKGYCNYYATAEVVMLRSIGIPARLAVGYAEGDSEAQGDVFTVRRKDSHAWPEVYFQGFGWVDFEPTASQPATVLPKGEESQQQVIPPNGITRGPEGNNIPSEEPTPFAGPLTNLPVDNTSRIILIIVIPLTIGGLVALFFWLRRNNRLRFLSIPFPDLIHRNLERRGFSTPKWILSWSIHIKLSPMEKLFTTVNWMLVILGHRPSPSATPAERVNELISITPNAKEPADAFLVEYQRDEYSGKPGNYQIARLANRRLMREVAIGTLRRIFTFG